MLGMIGDMPCFVDLKWEDDIWYYANIKKFEISVAVKKSLLDQVTALMLSKSYM